MPPEIARPALRSSLFPDRNMLRSPKDGARLKKAPKLAWARDAEADYYNFSSSAMAQNPQRLACQAQLHSQEELEVPGPQLQAQSAASTRWYVWPGFGDRTAADYGELLGFRTFLIVR